MTHVLLTMPKHPISLKTTSQSMNNNSKTMKKPTK